MKETWNRLTILVLLLVFTFSQLYLILASIGCTVDALFPAWVALICLSNWLTSGTRRGMLIGIPLSILLLYLAYRYYGTELMLQLNDLFDRITGVYMERVAYPGSTYNYLNAASDHSLLFVFMAFLFSSYMSSAITAHSGRLLLAMLGALPFTFASIAVNLHPPLWTILGILLFLFLLAAGGGHYADESNAYLATLWTLLPIALLLSALLLIVRPSSYQYDPREARLNQQLSALSQVVDTWISERADSLVLPYADRDVTMPPQEETEHKPTSSEAVPTLWQDGRGGMDLTQPYDETTLKTPLLQIRSDRSGSLYLRTVSYGDYTGTGWLSAEDYPGASYLSYTALAVERDGAQTHSLHVQRLAATPYRALPYFCTLAGEQDAFVPAGLLSDYSVSYTAFPSSFSGLTIPAELSGEELKYRAFAYEEYTRLPDSTRQTLQALCREAGLYPGMENAVQAVAQYVQSRGVYTLDVVPYPSEDYAVYFLTESREGYCVHFATAAAALYRTLGIPARVTEGFLVSAEAGRNTEVLGRDAHAWVEIYQDGLGWLPVEVTGQSGLDSDALGAPPSQPQPTTEPQTQDQTESGASQPEESFPVMPEPAAPEGEIPVGFVTQETLEQRDSNSAEAAGGFPFWALGLAAVFILALPFWRFIRRTLRYRSFEQTDARKAAVAIYRTALSASAFGMPIPEVIRVCAERAAFSRHPISRDEAEKSRDALYIMLKSLYLRLGPWKKFVFKYLRAFL